MATLCVMHYNICTFFTSFLGFLLASGRFAAFVFARFNIDESQCFRQLKLKSGAVTLYFASV